MKESKDLFSEMLMLGSEWRIEDVEFRSSDGVVVIQVAHTDWLWSTSRCADDGGKLRIHDRAQERVWRHLNVFQYRCEIRCRLPRGKCDMPSFRKEDKPEVIRAFILRKIKLYAIILRDLRKEFKPDYAKRYPRQMWNESGAEGGLTEEEEKARLEDLRKRQNEAASDTIMRDRHFMISRAIRRGEERLCAGLRQNFSGNPVAIREILVCAGYKTPAERADYWARMKKSGDFSHWSDADEIRLMPEPEEPPTGTTAPAENSK